MARYHAEAPPSGGGVAEHVDRGAWYILALLTLSYALSYVDRQIFNLVVDPIKSALGLTDTRVSFLQGASFICAYVIAAPFFGRLVDVVNRRNILIAGVCIWSMSTVACGFANSFWQLAVARFAVGISEACVFPVGMSLIPDLFPPSRTARALSLFGFGSQLGSGFSLLAGGGVLAMVAAVLPYLPGFTHLQPWQLAFVAVGLPGFALALILLTFKEPARPVMAVGQDGDGSPRECLSRIWDKKAFYGRIYMFCATNGIVFLSVPAWYPTFLIRVHHASAAQVGIQVGILTLLFGGAGVLLGPFVAQRLTKRGYADGALRAAAIASVGSFISCCAIPYASSLLAAMALNASIIFFCAFPTSLAAFSAQSVTPSHMRGMVGSLYGLTGLAIGYGVGPTLIALMTDRVFADPNMVGHSLQIVCGISAALVFVAITTNLAPYRRMLQHHTAG